MDYSITNIRVIPQREIVKYECNGEQDQANIEQDQEGCPYFIHFFEDGTHKLIYLSEEYWPKR